MHSHTPRRIRTVPLHRALLAALLLAAPGSALPGQSRKADSPEGAASRKDEVTEDYLREHYTKFEHQIPMRDGVRLFTAVYLPKDDSEPQPILLTRTPYGLKPYGVDRYPDPRGPVLHYAREKFIFALQDVRGRYASEGEYVHVRPRRLAGAGPRGTGEDPGEGTDESTDACDTIEWLVRNVPGNNGKVGMMGISYPGFYTAAGMIDTHPALKCASPQAPIADWFIGDDFHHNGAFYLPHAFRFFSSFGQTLEEPTRERPKPFDFKTPDGYEFYLKIGPLSNIDEFHFKGRISFWKELMEHPLTPNDDTLPRTEGPRPTLDVPGRAGEDAADPPQKG